MMYKSTEQSCVCVSPALQSCGYILPCQDHGGTMFSVCSYHCALKVYFIMWEGRHVQSKNLHACNLGHVHICALLACWLAKNQLIIDLWPHVCPLCMPIHMVQLSRAREMVPHVISSSLGHPY